MAVCVMALTVGRHQGLPEGELAAMGAGTLLQDIGKIGISKDLLEKKEELTSAERQALRQHVERGINVQRNNRPRLSRLSERQVEY